MIIISRGKLKFLRAGGTLTIKDSTGRYRRGREYKTSAGRVEVLEVLADGIRVRLAGDAPVYLAASPGAIRADYTEDPARAARDASGPVEAVDIIRTARGFADSGWLAREAKHASERDDLQRRERAKQQRLSIRRRA